MVAKKKIGEILIELGVITDLKLQAALEHQKRFKDKIKIGTSLVALGYITEEKLTQVLGHYLNLPVIDLASEFISPDIIDLVPPDVAEQYKVIPFRIYEENRKKILGLAMADPTNLEPIDIVQFHTSLNIRPYVAMPSDVEKAIQRYYHGLILEGISYVGPSTQTHAGEGGQGIKIITRGEEITWDGQMLRMPVPPPGAPGANASANPGGPKRVSTERSESPENVVVMNEMVRLLQETNAMMRVLVKKGIITEDEVNREVQSNTKVPSDEKE